MERLNIPDTDHVMRYCGPKHVLDKKIAEPAFALRTNETALSCNWLEYFSNGNSSRQMKQLQQDVSKNRRIKVTGRFASFNVGETKKRMPNLQIEHTPDEKNPSHADMSVSKDKNLQWTLELANIIQPEDIIEVMESALNR